MVIGMDHGVCATLMLPGLESKDWWPVERPIKLVAALEEPVISCYPSNLIPVVGERATFLAKTRSLH